MPILQLLEQKRELLIPEAQHLHELGLHPVAMFGLTEAGACRCCQGSRCQRPGKHPLGADWGQRALQPWPELQDFLQRFPDCNLGIRLGPESQVCDIETDGEEGRATAARLQLADCITPTYSSSRGEHRLFRLPPDEESLQYLGSICNRRGVVTVEGLECRLACRRDQRNEWAQVSSIVPPSVHASGVAYTWLPGLSPRDVDFAPLPDNVIRLLQEHHEQQRERQEEHNGQLGDDGLLDTHAGAAQGERHTIFCEVAGRWLARNPRATLETFTAVAEGWNRRCTPPQSEQEILDAARSLYQTDRANGGQPTLTVPRAETASGQQHRSRIIAVRGDQVQQRNQSWLWPEHFLRDELNLLAGPGKAGKGSFLCSVAAAITTGGQFPDGQIATKGDVIWMGNEEGIETTIAPRLTANGADMSRVHFVKAVEVFHRAHDGGEPVSHERRLNVVDDLEAFSSYLQSFPEGSVAIFDPVRNYLPTTINQNQEGDVAAAMMPLRAVAEKTGYAIILVRHFNGNESAAGSGRVMGSRAWVDVCRTIAGVERTKDDRRIYYFVDGNIPEFPGIVFDLEHIGPHDASLRVDCDPDLEHDPQSVIKPPQRRDSQSVGGQPRIDMAKGWLIQRLRGGRDVPPWPQISVSLIRQWHEAMEGGSFCWRVVERRATELQVERHGETRQRTWKLPDSYTGDATQ